MMSRIRTVHRRADFAVLGAVALVIVGAVPAVGLNLYSDDWVASQPAAIAVTLPDLPDRERARAFAAESGCLAEAMYYEARGEGVAGEKAVAEVILQRMRDGNFPTTVCGVVHQGAVPGHTKGCQFEFACNAQSVRHREKHVWRNTQVLAVEILLGKVKLHNATGHAIAFHNVGMTPTWTEGMIATAQIGSHVFYKRGHTNVRFETVTETPADTPPASASEEIQPHI